MEDCIFCKIVKGEAPAEVVAENESVMAFKNIKPVADTHILIVPKSHIENFVDPQTLDVITGMTKMVHQIVADKKMEGAYKLIFNGGKYQAVPHLHWHLLAGEMREDGT